MRNFRALWRGSVILSFLCCLASIAFWIYSYSGTGQHWERKNVWVRDLDEKHFFYEESAVMITSASGGIGLEVFRQWSTATIENWGEIRSHYAPAKWPQWTHGRGDGSYPIPNPFDPDKQPLWRWTGIHVQYATGAPKELYSWINIVCPYWLLCGLTAVPPACFIIGTLRKRLGPGFSGRR